MDQATIELDGGSQLARPGKQVRVAGVERWPGIIACCGPEGETAQPNPTDNTYWVQRGEAVNTVATDPLELETVTTVLYLIGEQTTPEFVIDETITQATTGATGTVTAIALDDDDHDKDRLTIEVVTGTFESGYTVSGATGAGAVDTIESPNWVLATNDAENLSETHLLDIGQYVSIRVLSDQTDPAKKRYVFTLMPAIVLFALGGWFNAHGTVHAVSAAAAIGGRWSAESYTSSPADELIDIRDWAWFQGELYAIGSFTLPGPVDHIIVKWDAANRRWVGVTGHAMYEGHCALVWDDGTGEAIYFGGLSGGGGPNAAVKFDGVTWTALPLTSGTQVNVFCVYDKGDGEALYCGGNYGGYGFVKRLAAGVWVNVGTTPVYSMHNVYALAVYDAGLGLGEELFAGGHFYQIGGVAAENIARWDGTDWRPCGDGFVFTGVVETVRDMLAWDDGEETRLYIVGTGLEECLWSWDGRILRRMGQPLTHWNVLSLTMNCLCATPQGLLVGGSFTGRTVSLAGTGVGHVARYNESEAKFEAMGAGLGGTVHTVIRYGGQWTALGAFSGSCARFDETAETWGTLAAGLGDTAYAGAVWAGDLYIGGNLTSLWRWTGSALLDVGSFNGPVHALLTSEAADGVFVAGHYDIAFGQADRLCLTKWDGGTAEKLLNNITAIDGWPVIRAIAQRGDYLYIGGSFDSITDTVDVTVAVSNVARLHLPTGVWSAMGGGTDGEVRRMDYYPPDQSIYIGGIFQEIDGGTPSPYVAKWSTTAETWASASDIGLATLRDEVTAIAALQDAASEKICVAALRAGSPLDRKVILEHRPETGGFTVLGGADGTFDDDVLTMALEDGEMVVGGRFLRTGNLSTTVELPAQKLVLRTREGWQDWCGGVGHHPMAGLTEGMEVHSIRRIQEPTHVCETTLVGGYYRGISRGYCAGAARITSRGMVPMQGGFSGGYAGPKGIMGAVKGSDGDWYLGGVWARAVNRWIADADVATVTPVISCPNVIRWDGRYFHALGGGVGGMGILAMEEYEGEIHAVGYTTGPKVWAPGPETWSVLDPVLGSGTFPAMKSYADELWFGGDFLIGSTPHACGAWNGVETIIRNPPGIRMVRDFVVADMGDGEAIYAVGEHKSGSGQNTVVRWNTVSWVNVGADGEMIDSIYSIGFCLFDEGPRLVVALIEEPGTLWVWDGVTWEPIVSIVTPGLGVMKVRGSAGDRKIYLTGLFAGVSENGEAVMAPNFASWTPSQGPQVQRIGGINGEGFSIA